MELFDIIAILLCLTAIVSYCNHQFLRLPTMIGAFVASMLVALSFEGLESCRVLTDATTARFMDQIDFNQFLMRGILGFLIFASAMTVNLAPLRARKWQIASFSVFGVVISAFVVGGIIYAIAHMVGLGLDFLPCLLFGALISPTDTIAVMGILKEFRVRHRLQADIAGESLFNDAAGVVMFVAVLHFYMGASMGPVEIGRMLIVQALGGAAWGLVLGYIGHRLIASATNWTVCVLITLAITSGGFIAAHYLHISGPLAMVISGVMVGNMGRRKMEARQKHDHLQRFWEMIDEIGNAVLFVLVGLEVVSITRGAGIGLGSLPLWLLSFAAIFAALMGRFIGIGIPFGILSVFSKFTRNTLPIFTWSGLRGGLSLAMAMSLPDDNGGQIFIRDMILTMTYFVVAFSIIVQGLTLGRCVSWLTGRKPSLSETPES